MSMTTTANRCELLTRPGCTEPTTRKYRLLRRLRARKARLTPLHASTGNPAKVDREPAESTPSRPSSSKKSRRRGRPQLDLEAMHRLAHERGGAFCSGTYRGVNYPHLWRCEKGHTWAARPRNIKQGSWCPDCAIDRARQPRRSPRPGRRPRRRLTLEDMQRTARERHGACLSTAYTNNSTSLHWRCQAGHTWTAKPYNILRGSWCPECARARLRQPRKKR